MDIVRINNVGTEEFIDKYDGATYRIPVGGETMVPLDAVILWCGHPEANDADPRNRVRQMEWERLRTRYGVYEETEKLAHLFPKLEVWGLDGTRVVTVLDDPEGVKTTTEKAPDTAEKRLAQLEAEIRVLRNALAETAAAEVNAAELAESKSKSEIDPNLAKMGIGEDGDDEDDDEEDEDEDYDEDEDDEELDSDGLPIDMPTKPGAK